MQRCPPAPYYFDQGYFEQDVYDDPSFSYGAFYHAPDTSKRSKPERACDFCRRRKTKCDGAHVSDGPCTNCSQNSVECTYMEVSKPRGPPKAYVTALEDRMEKMEALLTRLRPEADLDVEVGPAIVRGSWQDGVVETTPPPPPAKLAKVRGAAKAPVPTPDAPLSVPDIRIHSSAKFEKGEEAALSDGSDDSDERAALAMLGGLKCLTLNGEDATSPASTGPTVDSAARFRGKSSTLKLIGATVKLKEKLADEMSAARAPGMADDEVSTCSQAISTASYREEYWATPEWELACESEALDTEAILPYLTAAYPPDDLANALIDLFFKHMNVHWPLLHRPTFERQRAQGLHERDVWFAAVCIDVFAVGSRWSDDPRVLAKLEGESSPDDSEQPPDHWHSAGWGWFEIAVQLHQARRTIVQPVGLFEVQSICLLALYLRGTEYEAASWLYLSVGLRKAQDAGAHRRRMYGAQTNAESELWKRAFWVLVVQDRLISAHLGRDCSCREEEFDVDLPAEVDDEYWNATSHASPFKQPKGKPSIISAFVCRIKLSQVMAFALRTVCSSDKSKLAPGQTGPKRKKKIITELNAGLSEWVKSVPEHLRWAAKTENQIFAQQSAALFTTYYLLQILIYRPFVAPPCTWSAPPGAPAGACAVQERHAHPHAGFPFPAAAICGAAARALADIADQLVVRALGDAPVLITAAQLAAAVLVAYAWELKVRAQVARAADVKPAAANERPAVVSALADVEKVLHVLEAAKERWSSAGALLEDLRASMPGVDDEVRLPSVIEDMNNAAAEDAMPDAPWDSSASAAESLMDAMDWAAAQNDAASPHPAAGWYHADGYVDPAAYAAYASTAGGSWAPSYAAPRPEVFARAQPGQRAVRRKVAHRVEPAQPEPSRAAFLPPAAGSSYPASWTQPPPRQAASQLVHPISQTQRRRSHASAGVPPAQLAPLAYTSSYPSSSRGHGGHAPAPIVPPSLDLGYEPGYLGLRMPIMQPGGAHTSRADISRMDAAALDSELLFAQAMQTGEDADWEF